MPHKGVIRIVIEDVVVSDDEREYGERRDYCDLGQADHDHG
jgi:hypothetical protein